MSSNDKPDSSKGGYCCPSLVIELFATLIGLALVYGMITLIGNATAHNEAAMVEQKVGQKQPQSGMAHSGKASQGASASRMARLSHGQRIDVKALDRFRVGSLAAFFLHKHPKTLPAFGYVDEQGGRHSLRELRGKVVLLNLWATWCGPCRHEMGWLDELKRKYGGKDFEMLTISVDRGGLQKPRRFFNQIGAKHLTLYGDPTGRLAPTLRAFGMPTTLLIDRQGREVGRINGPADWNSKEAFAFIEAALYGPRDRSGHALSN